MRYPRTRRHLLVACGAADPPPARRPPRRRSTASLIRVELGLGDALPGREQARGTPRSISSTTKRGGRPAAGGGVGALGGRGAGAPSSVGGAGASRRARAPPPPRAARWNRGGGGGPRARGPHPRSRIVLAVAIVEGPRGGRGACGGCRPGGSRGRLPPARMRAEPRRSTAPAGRRRGRPEGPRGAWVKTSAPFRRRATVGPKTSPKTKGIRRGASKRRRWRSGSAAADPIEERSTLVDEQAGGRPRAAVAHAGHDLERGGRPGEHLAVGVEGRGTGARRERAASGNGLDRLPLHEARPRSEQPLGEGPGRPRRLHGREIGRGAQNCKSARPESAPQGLIHRATWRARWPARSRRRGMGSTWRSGSPAATRIGSPRRCTRNTAGVAKNASVATTPRITSQPSPWRPSSRLDQPGGVRVNDQGLTKKCGSPGG